MPDRPPLPYIDLKAFKGLFTKPIPQALTGDQLRTCSNVDFFRKYAGVSKVKGTARVLASQYQESGANKPVSWVGFYKYPDNDGQILRRVLIAAGTTLQLVNTSSGALTSLSTGRTNNLYHMDAQLDRFMYITNQNDLLVGQGDQMVKYDGHEISNWGIRAPGQDETVQEAFDDASDWTGTNATLTDESTTTYDGDSVKMVDGGGATTASMLKVLSSTFAAPTDESNKVRFYVYISPPSFDLLATSGAAIQAWFGSDGNLSSNYYRYDTEIGSLVPGWNTITCNFASAPTSTGTPGSKGDSSGTLVTSAIKTIQFASVSATAASTPTVYWDRLHTLSLGALSASLSGTGSVFNNDSTTSIWKYRVTFLTKYGLESNAGPAFELDNRSGGQTYAQSDITGIPTSADGQVIARRLYRTIGQGGNFLRLAQINDNITTTYTDTTADGSLGTATPPILGSTLIGKDTAIPPQAGIVAVWKKTVFLAGDPLNPTTLYYSQDAAGESFPSLNTFDFPERITGMFKSNFGLVICTETSFWRVTGDNPNFDVERALDGMGCVARRAAGTTRTMGWATDLDGMRLFDLQNQTKISEPIRDKYGALDRTKIDDLHTAHSRKENAIIQMNPDSSGDFDSAFMMQYWVDDPTQGFWSTLDMPSQFNIKHMVEIEDSNGDPKLYGADGDGMLFELFNDSATNWIYPDGTSAAITSSFSTPAIRLGEAGRQMSGFAGRCHPRLIELQTNGDTTDWVVKIEMFKGPDSTTAMDSQEITFSVGADKSLLRISTKDLHPAEYMKFTLTNSDASVSSTVENLRVYFYVKGGQFPVTTAEDAGPSM
jgi:hypothetical protein